MASQGLANVLGNVDESMRLRTTAGPDAADRTADALRREAVRIGRKPLANAAVIDIDRIVADPDQPRDEFADDDLQFLADSIRDRGQIQPIRVRWVDEVGRYMIVVGERRWRAAKMAGLPDLACVVATGPATAEEILEEQLIENCLRVDLRPIAKARAIHRLMVAKKLSSREVAGLLRISRSSVVRSLALLGLPDDLQADVESGAIAPSTGHALALVADPAEQSALASAVKRGEVGGGELRARTRKQPTTGRPRSWSTVVGGRVRVTVSPVFADVSDDEIHAAIKAAAGQYGKAKRRAAG